MQDLVFPKVPISSASLWTVGRQGSVLVCVTYKRLWIQSPALLNVLQRCAPRQDTLLTCPLSWSRCKWYLVGQWRLCVWIVPCAKNGSRAVCSPEVEMAYEWTGAMTRGVIVEVGQMALCPRCQTINLHPSPSDMPWSKQLEGSPQKPFFFGGGCKLARNQFIHILALPGPNSTTVLGPGKRACKIASRSLWPGFASANQLSVSNASPQLLIHDQLPFSSCYFERSRAKLAFMTFAS